MIGVDFFYKSLKKGGVDFFTGVPDSLLKDICLYISDNEKKEKHIISANEGGAIALAVGYHLASNKVPLVYMQNSGFGNSLNPLLSIADTKVYSIPIILLIGWRGEPGTLDEPQHIKQGEVTEELLKVLNIPYVIIANNTPNVDEVIDNSIKTAYTKKSPYVILVKKGTFEKYEQKRIMNLKFDLSREEAIIKSAELLLDTDIIVGTTGKTSRELYEFRKDRNQGHHRDFLTVGGMGHANQIALGIALAKPSRNVYCFDGDGAILMHTGSLGMIGDLGVQNFKHIIFNNGAHDSVGGQPTIGNKINFRNIAKSFNYNKVFLIEENKNFNDIFINFQKQKGPSLLEIKINSGSRKDLGRPKETPIKNKNEIMHNLLE